MVKNLWKIKVFEGLEAPRQGQVGPKMGPSWGKMVSGSELDGIFGHLETKMAMKLGVRRKMLKNLRKTYVFRRKSGKST